MKTEAYWSYKLQVTLFVLFASSILCLANILGSGLIGFIVSGLVITCLCPWFANSFFVKACNEGAKHEQVEIGKRIRFITLDGVVFPSDGSLPSGNYFVHAVSHFPILPRTEDPDNKFFSNQFRVILERAWDGKEDYFDCKVYVLSGAWPKPPIDPSLVGKIIHLYISTDPRVMIKPIEGFKEFASRV